MICLDYKQTILFMNGEIYMYKLIIDNADKGIAIMANDAGKLSAYVNGKHYGVHSFRPLNGDGRQLRDDSRNAIRELLPKAEAMLAELKAHEAQARETMRAEALEQARKEATPAPRSFAEVLEQSFIQTLTEKSAGDMVNQIYPIVEKQLVEKFGLLPIVHEFHLPEREKTETKGILHEQFDKIINILTDRTNGMEAVYLCGPAGTGKSFIAQQAAKALGVEYYESNSVTDETKITGFIDANGRYHETEFYRAFVNGGVFLLDELDASISEVLTLLNNSLANGSFAFPTGRKEAHKDFYCIAAGNTYGTGADNQYTGRYQLDAATMDRFSFIEVNYDKRIELAMTANDNELVNFAHEFRAAVAECGVSCLCTYRAVKRLHKFAAYMEKPEAIRIALTKGLPADDCRMVYNKLKTPGNAWAKALEVVSASALKF
jgi:MoxR-like ATPase